MAAIAFSRVFIAEELLLSAQLLCIMPLTDMFIVDS